VTAALSLAALLVAIALSCFAPVHVGVVCMALAFLVGHYSGGMTVAAVAAGFPTSLFVTLFGVTLLFAQANANGTLDRVAARTVRAAHGNRGAIPVVFFLLALALSAVGPGGIAASALLAPVAMRVAGQTGIGAFLMTLMVANGCNAGTLSPLSPTGIVARDLMLKAGLGDAGWANFWNSLAAQSLVAFGGYFAMGGLALFRAPGGGNAQGNVPPAGLGPLESRQKATLAMIALVVVAVAGFRVDVGMAALVAAAAISATQCADDQASFRAIPWNVLMLLSGVMMLVAVLEKAGGLEMFTSMLARVATPATAPGVMALVCGIVSVYSSSMGVVLPAFLPMVPGLVRQLGGGDPLLVAYSVNVGAHLVDVSPLSTIGAICIASAPPSEDRDLLFRRLLAWGWSMAFVGSAVCQLLFGFRGAIRP
jgi:di/tricarboxylate transporter